jgi:hypothetical protein
VNCPSEIGISLVVSVANVNDNSPGRYYASHVLKIFLSHLIMNYDIQQSKDQGPPPFFGTRRSFYFRSAIVPRSGTSFLFRKRREGKMDG